MSDFEKALMHRDGLTKEEAAEQLSEARAMVADCLENGDYGEAEEILCEFGLGPDYLFDLMPN